MNFGEKMLYVGIVVCSVALIFKPIVIIGLVMVAVGAALHDKKANTPVNV